MLAYTDGRAFKATFNSGSVAIITYPDKETKEISLPCGTFSSNFVAEKEAFDVATTDIMDTFVASLEKQLKLSSFRYNF